MSGWFSINRAIFDHPLFEKNPERLAVWVWLVGNAAWQDTTQNFRGKRIPIKRGQLMASYSEISKKTGVGIQVVRTLLNQLESQHAVNTATNTGRTIITLCNYDKYQTGNDELTRPKSDSQHGPNTQKNNINNKINTSSEEEETALSAPIEVNVVSKAVWTAGKPYLAAKGVPNPGAMIGRWLKGHPPLTVLGAIESAQKCGTEDPIPYITKALANGGSAPPAEADDVRAKLAETIRSGKRFLCVHIPIQKAEDLMHRGLVTFEECRAVGIMVNPPQKEQAQ